MNRREIMVGKLEKFTINLCTPALYLISLGTVPYKEITKGKEEFYKMMVSHLEQGEEFDQFTKIYSQITPCGSLALRTAKVRRYLKR
tara:strand:+ start:1878 stop:2138 length:261 start_codon:yes stop_codon:yes gene_type:complete